MNRANDAPQASEDGRLPITVTREDLEADLLTIYTYWTRVAALLAGESAAAHWMKQGLPDPGVLFNPDFGPEELGLQYEHIADLDFAKYSGWMHDYGFHAIDHASAESMGDESPYTWLSAHVFDLANSTLPEQFTNDSGEMLMAAAKRWLHVAELANARNILEGGESFFHFARLRSSEDIGGDGLLTIRQLALLSGMEEMSVRTAANPKRPNPLQTVAEDGRTFVKVDVAKAWLKRKGRYMHVRRSTDRSTVNLATAKIAGYADLIDLLDQRMQEIRKGDFDMSVWRRLERAGIVSGDEIDKAALRSADDTVITTFARELDIESSLLRLRVQEALAKDTLASVSRELARVSTRQ